MPLNIGKTEVEDNQVWFLAQESKRGLAGRRLKNFVALCGQAHFQELTDWRFVIDDQNLWRRGGHAAVSNFCDSVGIGSLIVNTAPVRSVRLPATIVPCMASTK